MIKYSNLNSISITKFSKEAYPACIRAATWALCNALAGSICSRLARSACPGRPAWLDLAGPSVLDRPCWLDLAALSALACPVWLDLAGLTAPARFGWLDLARSSALAQPCWFDLIGPSALARPCWFDLAAQNALARPGWLDAPCLDRPGRCGERPGSTWLASSTGGIGRATWLALAGSNCLPSTAPTLSISMCQLRSSCKAATLSQHRFLMHRV